MFKPKYNISPKLLENIKRISVLTAQLNGQHFPEAVLAKFEKKANEISAHASTSIEGNPLPLTEVKRIIKSKPEHIRDTEREVLNYNQALVELNANIKQGGVKLDLNLILKIQATITNGLVAVFRSGKLRQEAVVVNDPVARKVAYLPPDHQDVPGLMDDLLVFVRANEGKVDPLILAGIFHKQFVIIHPFMDGNGRTARLATKVLLANLGLDTFNLFSFENYYNNNVSRYFQFVGEKGNYYDIKDAINHTTWLEFFTDGIIDELIRVSDELKNAAITPETVLSENQQIILNHIKKSGYITDKIYATLVKRSKPSRVNDFNKLIRLGLISRAGKGKATIYKLSAQS
jgi:Fic family protein